MRKGTSKLLFQRVRTALAGVSELKMIQSASRSGKITTVSAQCFSVGLIFVLLRGFNLFFSAALYGEIADGFFLFSV